MSFVPGSPGLRKVSELFFQAAQENMVANSAWNIRGEVVRSRFTIIYLGRG